MKQQTYTSRRSYRNYNRNQNINKHKFNFNFGPISTVIISGLMLSLLGLIYLVQATKTTQYDYKISKIDSQINELTIKKADFEIEKARLASLKVLNESQVAKNMTNASQVTYINQ